MQRVQFTRAFLIAGGPQYRAGERAGLSEEDAAQALAQGAAIVLPPMDKMVIGAANKGARIRDEHGRFVKQQ